MKKPHFIIAGAPRSGTTWLCELLKRHPSIYLAQLRPEPKFFIDDRLYEMGIEYYSNRWFAQAPEGTITGEKSTNYLENAKAATRMARDVADCKLIFILREPAERAYSNFLWSRMNGMETEEFEVALQHEESRERNLAPSLEVARPHAYFSRGLYAAHLRPFFDHFPKRQILCLRYEDIAKSPELLTEKLHRFLGVSYRPEDLDDLGIINPSEACKDKEMPPDLKSLQARYIESNRELATLLGPEFEVWKY